MQQLLTETAAAAGEDQSAAGESGDMSDSAEPLTRQEDDDAVAAALGARLDAIAQAEQRLDKGVYGRSVRSGLPIPDDRLTADPAAELTIEEAREAP